MKARLLLLLCSVVMLLALTVSGVFAHNYGYWYDCSNYNTHYYRHVNVQFGPDRHEYVIRSMTYSEWYYQC